MAPDTHTQTMPRRKRKGSHGGTLNPLAGRGGQTPAGRLEASKAAHYYAVTLVHVDEHGARGTAHYSSILARTKAEAGVVAIERFRRRKVEVARVKSYKELGVPED